MADAARAYRPPQTPSASVLDAIDYDAFGAIVYKPAKTGDRTG